ncbi:MAG TPA: WbqC family protein [Flavobacteriales bacterium]|nr:WbqC family protein [Flavobacteriales bacterium]HRO39727.1 WbqC family protein [Flavobacteriales bacterium]HRP82130.1 WbqC family protein [Flavobacteriales bacterium]
MPQTPLFSPFYFGSVEHYALIARSGRVVIDLGEHYERQSYRTRTSIVGPNGRQDLQVHIARRSGEKMPMHSVGLSYAEPWHRQHLHAIRSAYGQTPWFIHFIDDLEQTLGRRYAKLVNLDTATFRLALKWLGLDPQIAVENRYLEPEVIAERNLLDLRTALQPKKSLPSPVPAVPAYGQVFADRHGFQGRLGIIDLVMNLGPGARQALTAGSDHP